MKSISYVRSNKYMYYPNLKLPQFPGCIPDVFSLMHTKSEGVSSACPLLSTVHGPEVMDVAVCIVEACLVGGDTINVYSWRCDITRCAASGDLDLKLTTTLGVADIYTSLGRYTSFVHYRVCVGCHVVLGSLPQFGPV